MKQWFRNHFASFRPASHVYPHHPPPAGHFSTILKEAKTDFDDKWKHPKNEYTAQLSDFELIRVLGRGKFGNVIFARYRKLSPDDPKAFVAIKVMVKRTILKNRGPQHIINEKDVLMTIRHPFFIKYKHHFKDNANLFLVTEYVPGGDFYTRLKRTQIFEESQVVFYSAQIVLAFEYLHHMGVIYRDLKPENILFDKNGYIKIADLGLCKKIDMATTNTMCGTPEYLAPEVIHGRAYGYAVDWWTLGIFIFELIHGKTPFRTASMLQLLRNIVRAKLVFPKPEINAPSKDIISQLLAKHITERLINPTEIKKMAYFASINWLSLYRQQMPAPYIPVVQSPTDTSNFDQQPEIHIEESETNEFADTFTNF